MNSARYAILEGAIKEIGDFKVTLFGDICPDHVISTGHQMTNLVSNFEYLLLLCFLTVAKGALTQKR